MGTGCGLYEVLHVAPHMFLQRCSRVPPYINLAILYINNAVLYGVSYGSVDKARRHTVYTSKRLVSRYLRFKEGDGQDDDSSSHVEAGEYTVFKFLKAVRDTDMGQM